MITNKIISSKLYLLDTSKSNFIDECFSEYIIESEKSIYFSRDTFNFGLEVSDAILDYKINYEQYNEK